MSEDPGGWFDWFGGDAGEDTPGEDSPGWFDSLADGFGTLLGFLLLPAMVLGLIQGVANYFSDARIFQVYVQWVRLPVASFIQTVTDTFAQLAWEQWLLNFASDVLSSLVAGVIGAFIGARFFKTQQGKELGS